MSNLARLEFSALDVSGRNYLTWVLDAELHLASHNLGETIKEKSTTSDQDKAKAMILLRHHLHEDLKAQYLTIKNPHELWKSLKDRFEHQKTITLPRARYEFMHLRLQDFKKVHDYNSELCRIASILDLCGETITDSDKLEKTLSTFHASNLVLQQQYREKGFKTYSELLTCLILAEENNQLLLNNHHNRPTGSKPLPDRSLNMPEANATSSRRGRGRGRGQSRGRGRGRGRGRSYGQGHEHDQGQKQGNTWFNQDIQKKHGNKFKKQNQHERHSQVDKSAPQTENLCHRCGIAGHWARTCRTAPHLVELYQKSLKAKDKDAETNFATVKGSGKTHLEAADFFKQVNETKPVTERESNYDDDDDLLN